MNISKIYKMFLMSQTDCASATKLAKILNNKFSHDKFTKFLNDLNSILKRVGEGCDMCDDSGEYEVYYDDVDDEFNKLIGNGLEDNVNKYSGIILKNLIRIMEFKKRG